MWTSAMALQLKSGCGPGTTLPRGRSRTGTNTTALALESILFSLKMEILFLHTTYQCIILFCACSHFLLIILHFSVNCPMLASFFPLPSLLILFLTSLFYCHQRSIIIITGSGVM